VAANVLFKNPGHGHRWITLRLSGVKSNRSAIGARIMVVIEEPDRQATALAIRGRGSSRGSPENEKCSRDRPGISLVPRPVDVEDYAAISGNLSVRRPS
jgi:hypothetical protein